MHTSKLIHDLTGQRLIILSIAIASFICLLDGIILNISLPTLANYFHANVGTISWAVLSYYMFFSATLLIFGKLSDTKGFKTIFIIGFVLFGVGSSLCAFSWNLPWLIVGRSIQGLGGAIFSAIAPAIICTFLPPNTRGKAFGIRVTASGLGLALGAPLGGLIITYLSWHWIFIINIPLCLLSAWFVYKLIPKQHNVSPNEEHSFDYLGAALCFIFIISLIYVLNMVQELGWSSFWILFCIAIAIITLIIFLRVEIKASNPLVDLKCFNQLDFLLANIVTFLIFMLQGGISFLSPFFLIWGKGLNVLAASIIMLLSPLVMIVAAPFAGRMADRINPYYLCLIGILIFAISCVELKATISYAGLSAIIVFSLLQGVASTIFLPANNYLVMLLAPRDKQGVASGIFKVVTQLGLALGVCILQLVYSGAIPSSLLKSPAAKVNALQVVAGVQHALVFGTIVCLLAFFFCWLGYYRQKKTLT